MGEQLQRKHGKNSNDLRAVAIVEDGIVVGHLQIVVGKYRKTVWQEKQPRHYSFNNFSNAAALLCML